MIPTHLRHTLTHTGLPFLGAITSKQVLVAGSCSYGRAAELTDIYDYDYDRSGWLCCKPRRTDGDRSRT